MASVAATVASPLCTPAIMSVLNDAMLDARLQCINKQLVYQQFDDAIKTVFNTLVQLVKCTCIRMDPGLYKLAVEEFFKMRVDVALHRYEAVRERVRNLHHKILASYIPDDVDDDRNIDNLIGTVF